MNDEYSPSQTPTVASMSQRRPMASRSSPLASSFSTPASPETATFANTNLKRAADTEKPLPPVTAPELAPNPRPGAARGSKARDLLRQHYGMVPGPPAPIPGRSDDPMDIDSKAFNAKTYYEQLITTTSLTGLLKKENELAAEIRQLDGEKQSLVYNHHHELIAASDTITAMKSRADTLESDVEKLRMAFSEISRLMTEVTKDDESKSGSV
ncbi:hypothetical protein CPB86DRAFT_693474 [Serendipita vermifera]|nr:hypothetical protein CPB86DRAFT_693474 [Serendipita vermifera]